MSYPFLKKGLTKIKKKKNWFETSIINIILMHKNSRFLHPLPKKKIIFIQKRKVLFRNILFLPFPFYLLFHLFFHFLMWGKGFNSTYACHHTRGTFDTLPTVCPRSLVNFHKYTCYIILEVFLDKQHK